jgi:Fe-S-cluster containining protein
MSNPPLDSVAVLELRKLYATLPTLKCRRLCSNSCRTKISMSTTERGRVERVLDAELPEWMGRTVGAVCPLLDVNDCRVYGVRPMICRLWGLAESMRCPHGCVPSSGRWFSDVETMELLTRSFKIGGGIAEIDRVREIIGAAGDHPELYRRMLQDDRGAAAADELRAIADRNAAAGGG